MALHWDLFYFHPKSCAFFSFCGLPWVPWFRNSSCVAGVKCIYICVRLQMFVCRSLSVAYSHNRSAGFLLMLRRSSSKLLRKECSETTEVVIALKLENPCWCNYVQSLSILSNLWTQKKWTTTIYTIWLTAFLPGKQWGQYPGPQFSLFPQPSVFLETWSRKGYLSFSPLRTAVSTFMGLSIETLCTLSLPFRSVVWGQPAG